MSKARMLGGRDMTTRPETLYPMWKPTESCLLGYGFWEWTDSNGVFQYRLTLDIRTREWYLHVDRVDAGRSKTFGPFVNHTTATKKVLKHIAGGDL